MPVATASGRLHVVSEQDDLCRAEHDRQLDRLKSTIAALANHAGILAQSTALLRLDVVQPHRLCAVLVDRPELACAMFPDRLKMFLPPRVVAGIQHVSPRRELIAIVNRNYKTTFLGRPRGFGAAAGAAAISPTFDCSDVVSVKAWAACDTDDG